MTSSMSTCDSFGFGALEQSATGAPDREGANLCVRELTALLHIDCPADAWLARTVFASRRLRDGAALMHAGDRFHSLYVVRSGGFKTVYTDSCGSEQVLGFPMCGDLMGADGIDCGRYGSTAVALDTSEVAIVPIASLAQLVIECPSLEDLLSRILSRELVRMQNMAWTMGTLGAEGRVAAFLLGLSARLGALGYSPSSFNLRMTRQEIGSYLGLKLETVSRSLSALHGAGFIQVHQRRIDIVDADGLRGVIDPTAADTAGIAAQLRTAAPRQRPGHDARALKSRPQLAPALAWRQLAPA